MTDLDQKALAAALLPCPFCGGEARLIEWSFDYENSAVECSACEVMVRADSANSTWLDRSTHDHLREVSNAEAIALWNRRASLPAPEPVAMDLRGIVHEAVRNTAARSPSLRGPYVFDEANLQASAASPPSHQGLREALAAADDLIIFWRDYRELPSDEFHEKYKMDTATSSLRMSELALRYVEARAALQSQPAPSGETK